VDRLEALGLKTGDLVHFEAGLEHATYRITSRIQGPHFISYRAESVLTTDVRFITEQSLPFWHLQSGCGLDVDRIVTAATALL